MFLLTSLLSQLFFLTKRMLKCVHVCNVQDIKTFSSSLIIEQDSTNLSCSKKEITNYISGIFKIPMVILFVILGNILRTLISSLIRPCSDHLLKPVLVSIHNLVLAPIFSLLYNLSSMVAMVLSPCCSITRVSAPWQYVTLQDKITTDKQSLNV